jgi:hypothetical protein
MIGQYVRQPHRLSSGGKREEGKRNTDPRTDGCSRPFVLLTGGQPRDCSPLSTSSGRTTPAAERLDDATCGSVELRQWRDDRGRAKPVVPNQG